MLRSFRYKSRQEMADMFGVSETCWRRWVSGRAPIPDWVWDRINDGQAQP